MTSSTLQRGDLKPKSADGTGRGFAMAAVVHVGLVICIAFGVSWRASEPEGVEAELWAAVPQVAAQRDVAPEPAPPKPAPAPKPEPKPAPAPPAKAEAPDPQIAIEKAKQEKLKKQREEDKREREEQLKKQKEDDRREKAELDKKKAADEKARQAKAADEQKRIDDQRADNLARMRNMMGENTGSSTSTAARSAGPSAAYAGRIKARIKPNILFTENIDANPQAEVEVRCSADGTIISAKLIKSSGVKAWDDAVVRAVEKTEILPRDESGTVPSPMVIAFRPRDL